MQQAGILQIGFEEAGRLFPGNTKLLINEGAAPAHDTTGDYVGMIVELLRESVPVAGIGIQFHAFDQSFSPRPWRGSSPSDTIW